MKKIISLLLALCTLAALATGCGSASTKEYNLDDVMKAIEAVAPVTVPAGKQATAESVEQAIIRAGNGLGWQMKVEKPGLIVGTLNLRTHTAVVDIPFTASNYSILYRSSVNLNQQGDQIHSNYNGWVQNLDQAIRNQLQTT